MNNRTKIIIGSLALAAVIIALIALAFVYSMPRHDTFQAPQTKTYTNDIYGYSFQYPVGFDAIQYTNELMSVSTSTSADVISVFESGVYNEGLMEDNAKNLCAADGPESTIYCDKVTSSEDFLNNNGILGTKFWLQKVTENLKTHEKATEPFGPFYSFGNVLFHPPYMVSPYDPNFALLQKAVDTFRQIPVKEVATSTVATSTSGGRVRGPEDITLQQGATGEAAGLAITFNRLVQDSRCPIDVQCIQAGAVNTNITLRSGNTVSTQNYASDGVPLVFAGYSISIKNVLPARSEGKEIAQKEYKVTFHIAPNTKGDTI